MRVGSVLVAVLVLGACADDADDAGDGVDDAFTGPKADGLGLEEGSADACALLRAANEATRAELDDDAGLDARAARGIVVARPLATLAALDAVPYVGEVTAGRLLEYALAGGLTCDAGPTPPACAATGGTYDGVAFSAEEECHAVDFMNHARFSEMASLGASARDVVYRGCPSFPCAVLRAWPSVAAFAAYPRIGQTSVAQVKAAAAGWTRNGLPYDTVANTWEDRAALDGAPLQFEKVHGTSVRSTHSSPGWFYDCIRIEDAPGAPNYLEVCVRHNPTDSGTTCTGDAVACVDAMVGAWFSLRGTLYGNRVIASDSGPREASGL